MEKIFQHCMAKLFVCDKEVKKSIVKHRLNAQASISATMSETKNNVQRGAQADILSKSLYPWQPIWQKAHFLTCLLSMLSRESSDFVVTAVKCHILDLVPEIGSLKKFFRFPELENFL